MTFTDGAAADGAAGGGRDEKELLVATDLFRGGLFRGAPDIAEAIGCLCVSRSSDRYMMVSGEARSCSRSFCQTSSGRSRHSKEFTANMAGIVAKRDQRLRSSSSFQASSTRRRARRCPAEGSMGVGTARGGVAEASARSSVIGLEGEERPGIPAFDGGLPSNVRAFDRPRKSSSCFFQSAIYVPP